MRLLREITFIFNLYRYIELCCILFSSFDSAHAAFKFCGYYMGYYVIPYYLTDIFLDLNP